jgi:hypothetical protein
MQIKGVLPEFVIERYRVAKAFDLCRLRLGLACRPY